MGKSSLSYDSREETLEHIRMVQLYISSMVNELLDRGTCHDESKLKSPEKEVFDEWTPRLSGVTFGSDEYREMLSKMRPAIAHHQKNNRHHPEFHGPAGVNDMDLVDLVEMLCDWKAATLRHADGDIQRSIEINEKRHNLPPSLVSILKNTIANMGW